MAVQLPLYEWFTAEFDKATGLGNCWSGSCGTDALRGGMDRPLFEYSVLIRRDQDKNKTITASWWIRPAWPQTLSPDAVESCTFEGTREGLNQAAAWLSKAQEDSGLT